MRRPWLVIGRIANCFVRQVTLISAGSGGRVASRRHSHCAPVRAPLFVALATRSCFPL